MRLISANANTDNNLKGPSSLLNPVLTQSATGFSQPQSQSTSIEEMKKRLDKIQRVVLVESKEIKSLKEKNSDLQKQINRVNENYDKLFNFLSKSRNNSLKNFPG